MGQIHKVTKGPINRENSNIFGEIHLYDDRNSVIFIIKTRFMFVCVCVFVCPVCIKVVG